MLVLGSPPVWAAFVFRSPGRRIIQAVAVVRIDNRGSGQSDEVIVSGRSGQPSRVTVGPRSVWGLGCP